MSTHDIGFYEDLNKTIFQLLSNRYRISSSAYPCNSHCLEPPFLYSKTGVYKGIHYFSYF